ncbi:MAG TPA: helix-turn-helix domain-containing protein [Actinotalea sp.]|nr:helix-turn-helix domain-containing protein [Actinotalea sp.]HRA49498.1 helix-turn-helix domain-containing protein [Actinotalea sp.]
MSRDDRRAQVLTVAQELFAREGFHHVSMDDIAVRAEVSKPVLYRHFPSKLDLYLAVVDHRGEALVAAVDAALARAETDDDQPADGSTTPRVVRALVGAYVAFVEDAGDSSSLLFESDVTHDDAVRARVESASDQAARAISRGLRDATGLPSAHADLLAAALVGMAQVAATHRYRSRDVAVDEAVELVSRLAWGGVSGLRPAEGGPS